MKCAKFAILLHDSLHAIAMRQLLGHIPAASCAIISSAADILDADYIITDSTHFTTHVKQMLPLLSRVIIVDNTAAAVTGGDIMWIDSTAGENAIMRQLAGLINKSADEVDESTAMLTNRETEVLRLIASGCINKEIADELNISINTVLTHRKNITAKLGIKSVSGLSLYAMMNGIIRPNDG